MGGQQDPGVTAVDPGRTVMEPGVQPLLLHGDGPGASILAATGSSLSFSRYPLIRRLGRGGAGEVFLAYDPRLDRKVAIKILTASGLVGHSDSMGKTRLLREAQAMARSPHPNVVSVYDVDTYRNDHGEGGIFIVMEYVEGPNLAEWYEQKRRRWRKVLRMVMAAGRGLVAAHEMGVIHRDFKPANVIVGKDGRARVLDFGLARGTGNLTPSLTDGERPLAEPEDDADFDRAPLDVTLTMAGRVLGTPAYMAPEQHRGAVADERADQFAFCVTLWEGLFGERPFKAKTFVDLEEEKRTKPPVPREGVRVPRWIVDALLKGMSARSEDRWPSMQALLNALRRGTIRRRRSGGAIAGVTSVALAVGGGWLFSNSGDGLCVGGDRVVGESWSEQRRESLETMLDEATGRGDGPGTGEVLARFDAYWEDWVEQYDDNCRQTRERSAQLEATMALRTACFDRQRRFVDASLSQLEMGQWQPDARHDAIVGLSVELPQVDFCSDVEALRARPDQPADATVAEEVRELRGELAKIAVLRRARRFDDAADRIDEAEHRARSLDQPGVLAESLLESGNLRSLRGDSRGAARTYLDAYATALAGGHDEAAARAAMRLAASSSGSEPNLEGVGAWLRIAEAQLERASLANRHRADFLVAKAEALSWSGRAEESHRAAEGALAALDGDDDPRRAEALWVSSLALEALGRDAEAKAKAKEARALRTRWYGARHPALDEFEESGASQRANSTSSIDADMERVDESVGGSVQSTDDEP